MKTTPLLLICVITIACTAPDAPPAPDPAVDARAIMEADRAFNAATTERGVEGWVSFFAEDGVMVLPGAEIRGTDEIRSVMTPQLSEGRSLTWEPERADVSASGDLGYTVGRYESRVPGPEGDVISTGSYVTIWQKDEEGHWKVALDVGAPDPA